MDKDLDQAKGKVKQAAGDLTDNKDLKREGKADETGGKVKEALSDAKDKLSDGVDSVKDKLTGKD
ncbi:MAG: CsbD family protein [Aquihabitans sp.]